MPLNDEVHVAIYNKLGLIKDVADPFANYFTGWKEFPIDAFDMDSSSSGLAVGQLVRFFREKTKTGHYHGVYVNLPGMEGGHIYDGGVFDIGTERIHLDNIPPSEEIEAMLVAGLEKLNALIEEWKDKEQ